MMPAAIPPGEPERLRALHEYGVLDTASEASFDTLTELVARLLRVPIALVSLVDAERQWFKSRYGLLATEGPRDASFCAHVVADGAPLIVCDAGQDERFFDHPMVTGGLHLRFYAGMPLRTAQGHVLGTLCAIDSKPRILTAAEQQLLALLAREVIELLEIGRRAVRERALHDFAEQASVPLRCLSDTGIILWANQAELELVGYSRDEYIGQAFSRFQVDERPGDGPLGRLHCCRGACDHRVRVRARDGTIKTLLVNSSAYVVGGKLVHTCCVSHDVTDLEARQAELAIHRRFFDLTADLLCTTGPSLHFEMLNPAWENALGWPLEQLRARPITDLIHQDDIEPTLRAMARLVEQSTSIVDFENRCRHRDGHFVALSWVCRAQDGVFYAAARDVTRYAAAVAERSASELRFRALIDSAVDAIIEFDEQGRIERVNPAVEKLFGYSPAELLGQSVNVLVAASDLVPGGRQLLGGAVGALGVLGAGRVISARRKDGSTFPAELAVSEFLIEGKRHFTSINRDISERERYVVELGQFKRTLDHTHDCILIFDPDTLRFSYANRGAVTHTGYSVEELLRMTPLDLNTSFDEAHFRELIAPLRLGAQEVVVFESIHRRKSGTEIPVEVMIQYLAPAGEMSRFVNIIRDISERKQNERMKSEFVSTVSHELRTPLTSIRGSLGLLSAGVTGELPATAKEYVDIALSNSDRLVRLINDILDLEKMHAGGIELRLKVVDLHTLLRNALVANHSLVAAPRATIALVGAVPDARVRVDEDRILQVLTNLIANAVKFSPPGQQVEVSVTLRDRWVRVSVRDHGCGIPEEFRGRIFQRFAQADSGEVRKGGGTGLGLSICKAIIEAMAGSIGFESAPGGGTIFYFELPLAPEMADADGGAGHGSHELLLCGTGLEVADHIARMVERSGARVHVAPVLPCAQQVIAARRYHVVALESALPDAADPALPSQLDLVGDEQSDPVVIIAGSGAGPVLGRFASAAMLVADIVPKPVDEERLLRAIWTTGDPVGAGWVVRVLHITADRVLRRIVERLLPAEWDVAGAATCGDARARLTSSRFDLVLLDLTLPGAAPRLLASVGSAQLVLVAADEPSAGLVRRLARILVDGRLQERRCRDAVVALLGARARAERYA